MISPTQVSRVNVCVRCGKQRIIISTKEETLPSGVITLIETSCPDLECQKLFEEQMASDKAKREAQKTAPSTHPYRSHLHNRGKRK